MPTINRVMKNMFTDNGGTVTVTGEEYDALLRERREIERRAAPVAGCEDVDGAMTDAARLQEICLMLGDDDAARAARQRYAELRDERQLQAMRRAEDAREYDRRLTACLMAAESVAAAYATLEDTVMPPEDVRRAARPTITPGDLDGSGIVARELSERGALAECEALAARCTAALEAFERPRPRGLSDRLKMMLEAVRKEAEGDARTARGNLAIIEAEKERRAEAEAAARADGDQRAKVAELERRIMELEKR